MKKTESRVFIPSALFILLLYAVPGSAQEQINAIFNQAEDEMAAWVEERWQHYTRNCEERIRATISSNEDVERYMDCVYSIMPSFIRDWQQRQEQELVEMNALFDQLFAQFAPSGESTAEQRTNLAGLGTYAFQRMAAWHSRMATMVQQLAQAGFFTGPESKGIIADFQKSMQDLSGEARSYVEAIQCDTTLSAEEVTELGKAYKNTLTAGKEELTARIQLVFINAVNRHQEQAPKLLERSGSDYMQFTGAFDTFIESAIQPIQSCAADLWTPVQQQGQQD